jgi:hypothetical protein
MNSPVNINTSIIRVQIALAQLIAYYASSANDAVAAVESGLRGGLLAQAARQPAQAIGIMGTTARYMIGAGRPAVDQASDAAGDTVRRLSIA